MLIVKYGLGFGDAPASGAFLGGSVGYAAMWGDQTRAILI